MCICLWMNCVNIRMNGATIKISFIRFKILAFRPEEGGRPPETWKTGERTGMYIYMYIYIVSANFWILPKACILGKAKYVTKFTTQFCNYSLYDAHYCQGDAQMLRADFGCDSNLHSRYCSCTMTYEYTWTSWICIVPSFKNFSYYVP